MILQEKFIPLNAEGGYYVTDKDKEVHCTYVQAREKAFFLDAVTNMESPNYRGDVGKFSYEHGIGLYFSKLDSFAYYIGAESHYDEEHVFYMHGFPGEHGEFKDKKVVTFQLRVSNHPTIHKQWEDKHARKKNVGIEFCLTLYLNPERRKNNTEDAPLFTAITDVCCDISDYYHGMPGDRKAKIDELIKRIQAGGAHVDWSEILFICGNKEPKVSSSYPNGVQHREDNFTEKKITREPDKNHFSLIDAEKRDKEKQEKLLPSELPSSIPYDIVRDLHDGDVFEYEGRKYKYEMTDEDMFVYPVRIKHGIISVNKSKPIEIMENRESIKISRSDIMEMVVRVVKDLLS